VTDTLTAYKKNMDLNNIINYIVLSTTAADIHLAIAAAIKHAK